MLFYLDLNKCSDVSSQHEEILERLKQRTIYGMQGGMPPDAPWSLTKIHTLELWKKNNFAGCMNESKPFCSGSNACGSQ